VLELILQAKIFLLVGLVLSIAAATTADTTKIFIGWDGTRFRSPDAGSRIGLALSGGGARGFAQIGALKAFEEAGIEITSIAGTSIGGIIGGLYAAGYSADSLEKIVRGINFSSLFSDRPSRTSLFLTQRSEKERYLASIRFDGFKPSIPKALTAGQRLTDLISGLVLKANYISEGSFSSLKIPFRAVTTDIVSGDEVILKDGNLSDAIRATMAFPLAFTGLEKGDMILMDGGMVNPIPVNVVRDFAGEVDLIVAINTTSPLLKKDQIRNPLDIANQVTTIMTMDKKNWRLMSADVAITPEIEKFQSSDFDQIDTLIKLGYEAGRKAVPTIMDIISERRQKDSIYISSVITNDSLTGDEIARSIPIGAMRRDELRQIIRRLYKERDLFSIETRLLPNVAYSYGKSPVSMEINFLPKPRRGQVNYQISGNTVFSDSAIVVLLGEDRRALSSEDVADFSERLKKNYDSLGYDLAHVRRLEYRPETNTIEIDIDEGIVEKIDIAGNRRTKRWLIRSYFTLEEGKPFKSEEASRGVRNIYATGLFDRVTIDLVRGKKGAIIRINVEERKYTQARLGWHWDDEYDSEEFIELLDDNLFGTGQESLMHARYSQRRQKYEISLKADRFFSTYLTYRAAGYYHVLERKMYDSSGNSYSSVREFRRGLEFILGQQISRFGTVTGELRIEEIKNSYRPSYFSEIIKLRKLNLRSLVETLDRFPFPTEGKKHHFYVEFAGDIFGGEAQYTKVYSSIESYFPIGPRLNFHPKISIGWSDAEKGLPASEKYYLGGAYSFAGFRTDELADDKMILGNMELRYKLPYRFYITGRYDTGETYSRLEQIKIKGLRHGYGFSIAYDSFLGPVDFGYGRSGKHPERYYINIGLGF
jgi:NTE family protein